MKKSLLLLVSMFIALATFAQKPVITFTKTTHDFGQINEVDGRVTTVFEFKNEGMIPLILNSVRASCGCTTPKWTKEPIEPGATGQITVTYNPNGRPGRFQKTITVNITAFGYKHGIPLDADLVLDVRFLPNPYYEEDLRQKTGLDPEVRNYVFASDVSREFMDKLTDLVDFLLPLYIEEGKFSLTIAVGCTGGRHRSVAVGYELRNHLLEKGINAVAFQRDIEK